MEKLPNFSNKFRGSRTNWKYVFIVVILSFVIGGEILLYSEYVTNLAILGTRFPTIEQREKKTETGEQENFDFKEAIRCREHYAEETILRYDQTIYRNKTFNFEFKYPKTYAEDDCAQVKEGKNAVFVGGSIELIILDSPTSSLAEFVEAEISRRELDVELKENTLVDGEKAIKIYFYYSRGYGESVLTIKNHKLYYFNWVDEYECPVAYEKGPDD